MIKKQFKLLILLLCFTTSLAFSESKIVKVGAYEFPPFVSWQAGVPVGLVVELLKEFNHSQNKYHFQLIETSAKRRYEDLKNKIYDIIFFESIHWGWISFPVNASNVFLVGGEVFITRQTGKKTQSYFDDLFNKTIRGILGYHYGFAHFSTDPQVLKKWKLELTNSHEGNIMAVVEERADLAIVTKKYLDIFLKTNPLLKEKILISQKQDQIYRHSVIVRNNAVISVQEINMLLAKIKNPI